MRLFAAAMVALFALGMFSVGSTVSARSIQVPARASVQSPYVAHAITVAKKKKKAKPVTGFGARVSAWNRTHKMVTKHGYQTFVKDVCYDWVAHEANASNLNGPGCRYAPVTVYGGIVEGFAISLPNHTTLTTAEKFALRQLPSNRKILWTVDQPNCLWQLIQSSTLAPILAGHNIGEPPGAGLVTVEFETTATADGAEVAFNQVNAPLIDLEVPNPALGAPGAPFTSAAIQSEVVQEGCGSGQLP